MTATRLALAWIVVCVGCGAERAEAERVAAAIDRMRDTPAAAREPLLDELEKLAISGNLARAARDSCALVYRLDMEGRLQLDAVDDELDGGTLADAKAKLEAAQQKLISATARYDDCKSRVRALKASIR